MFHPVPGSHEQVASASRRPRGAYTTRPRRQKCAALRRPAGSEAGAPASTESGPDARTPPARAAAGTRSGGGTGGGGTVGRRWTPTRRGGVARISPLAIRPPPYHLTTGRCPLPTSIGHARGPNGARRHGVGTPPAPRLPSRPPPFPASCTKRRLSRGGGKGRADARGPSRRPGSGGRGGPRAQPCQPAVAPIAAVGAAVAPHCAGRLGSHRPMHTQQGGQ